MMLGCLDMMVGGLRCVTMRGVSMMGCLFMVAALVVLRGLAMMTRGVFVVVSRGAMMFRALVFHDGLLKPGSPAWVFTPRG
jgi:hypothetical protein